MRAASFGAGAGEVLAAEGLYADGSADLTAVAVSLMSPAIFCGVLLQ
jgi:hypothetical protein